MGIKFTFTSLLILLLAGNSCYADDSLAKKFPVAILVQLRSEHNRIEALTKDRRYKELEEVKNDAGHARTTMIKDFQDHFTYCPVYYFMDTNIDRVKNKSFDGILFNSDGKQAKNLVINNSSDDYLFAYFGYPASRSNKDPNEPLGKGLVVLNDKLKQTYYLYKFGYDELFLNKDKKKYYYSSKHYDIEYFPLADKFNQKLKDNHIHLK